MIQVKRVYDPVAKTDGLRFLVDRIWPRGVRKERLALAGWLKDLAPSDGLRKWFNHDPSKWSEFKRRYFDELDEQPEIVRTLLEATRLSIPCRHIEEITGKAIFDPLINRSGLNCKILKGGIVRSGDAVRNFQ